jgi:hypothetical protein
VSSPQTVRGLWSTKPRRLRFQIIGDEVQKLFYLTGGDSFVQLKDVIDVHIVAERLDYDRN